MKVKLDINPDHQETEVTISAPEMNDQIQELYRLLQNQEKIPQIEGFKDRVSYYLNLADRDAYQVKYKLYELEDILGANYMRVSKSTILNLNQIYAITRSISNCQVKFQDSYKVVYVSRHYYRDLRNRLDERRKYYEK